MSQLVFSKIAKIATTFFSTFEVHPKATPNDIKITVVYQGDGPSRTWSKIKETPGVRSTLTMVRLTFSFGHQSAFENSQKLKVLLGNAQKATLL